MQIIFERTGGIAGMFIAAEIDTEQLPPAEAEQLAQLIQECQFFDIPERLPAAPAGADQFEYTITVEHEQRKHTVHASEAALPVVMEPLLSHLTLLARRPPASDPS